MKAKIQKSKVKKETRQYSKYFITVSLQRVNSHDPDDIGETMRLAIDRRSKKAAYAAFDQLKKVGKLAEAETKES